MEKAKFAIWVIAVLSLAWRRTRKRTNFLFDSTASSCNHERNVTTRRRCSAREAPSTHTDTHTTFVQRRVQPGPLFSLLFSTLQFSLSFCVLYPPAWELKERKEWVGRLHRSRRKSGTSFFFPGLKPKHPLLSVCPLCLSFFFKYYYWKNPPLPFFWFFRFYSSDGTTTNNGCPIIKTRVRSAASALSIHRLFRALWRARWTVPTLYVNQPYSTNSSPSSPSSLWNIYLPLTWLVLSFSLHRFIHNMEDRQSRPCSWLYHLSPLFLVDVVISRTGLSQPASHFRIKIQQQQH